jgi:hypothetical protein
LLISYDTPYPHPLSAVRQIQGNVGVALLLSPIRNERSVAQLSISLSPAPANAMPNAALESLRCNNPSARALPLLALLAKANSNSNRDSNSVVLDYLQQCNLAITVDFEPDFLRAQSA